MRPPATGEAMDETIKRRLTNPDLWVRGMFMILFAIAYSIAELVVVMVVVVQFLVVLFAGRTNEDLQTFGNNLSIYVYQILQFETFNTETRPFPFSPWPDEAPGETPWSGESQPEHDEGRADGDGPETDTTQERPG
jgi:hypothetical protein